MRKADLPPTSPNSGMTQIFVGYLGKWAPETFVSVALAGTNGGFSKMVLLRQRRRPRDCGFNAIFVDS